MFYKEFVMNSIIKRINAKVNSDNILQLSLPDVFSGEVEVIVIKRIKNDLDKNEILSLIPHHKAGKILSSLRREDIYIDAR